MYKRQITKFPEPVGAISLFYNNDMTLDNVASEIGIENPEELRVQIKGNPDLRELGLGPLVNGATIQRSAWTDNQRGSSVAQETARILQLGTPLQILFNLDQ